MEDKDFSKAARISQGPILALARGGMSSLEYRKFAIWVVRPFLRYPNVLQVLNESNLMSLVARIRSLNRQPWMLQTYAECLNIFKSAESISSENTLNVCIKWASDVRRGEALTFSNISVGTFEDGIVPEGTVLNLFRRIGTEIENSAQPKLRALLELMQVLHPTSKKHSQNEGKDFGDVVNELMQRDSFPKRLLIPQPWGIRINQWRNIAQHSSWQVSGSTIKCWHGISPGVKECQLSLEELRIVSSTILNISLVLATSWSVFLFDRLIPLVDLVTEHEDERSSLSPIHAYSQAVASYGFEITNFTMSDEIASVVVKDVTDGDPDQRCKYVISFAYHLVKYTSRSVVRVVYCKKDGTQKLQAELKAEDCENIIAGEWEKLSVNMKFTDPNSGRPMQFQKRES